MIRMSAESFRMIAGNLIENAEQAGATRIRIVIQPGRPGVDVLFCDNGHGVSPGNREKIYDPFFTTRRDAGGTGLGLGIVRSLVEAHNGRIELRPSEAGAIFALHFDIMLVQPAVRVAAGQSVRKSRPINAFNSTGQVRIIPSRGVDSSRGRDVEI